MMTDIYDANATEPVTETNFVWPEQPAEDWWLTQGAAIGMDSDTIRFAAALHNLGGADAKKNSKAAQLAGLGWNRVESFRAARSVSVQKLLREAKDIKRGRLPPLTEAEIDQKVDDLIRCPDALTVARGIELREKRKHTSGGGMSFDNLTPLDEVMVLVLVSCRYGQCRPETGPLFWAELLLPRDGWSCPLIRQMAPFLKQRYPQHWSEVRRHLAEWRPDELRAFESGPVLRPDQILEISLNNFAALVTVIDTMGDLDAPTNAYEELRRIGLIEQALAKKENTSAIQ
jgi:hypothetical protein